MAEVWRYLPVGDIEQGKENQQLLDQVAQKLIAYVRLKYPNTRNLLNTYFISSGWARTEMYLLTRLYEAGYKCNQVVLVDEIYEGKTDERSQVEQALLSFQQHYDLKQYILLESLEQLEQHLSSKLKDALAEITKNHGKVTEAMNEKYGVHLIVGIHMQFLFYPDKGDRAKFRKTLEEIDQTIGNLHNIGITATREIISYEYSAAGRIIERTGTFVEGKKSFYGGGLNDRYKQKYIKYKTKYLALKRGEK